MTAREPWRDRAKCAGRLDFCDADLGEQKAFCKGCPVTAECLQLALDTERPHEGRWHVYGGLSANERRMLVRKAATA